MPDVTIPPAGIAVCRSLEGELRAAHAVTIAAGDVPEWVQFIPVGPIATRDGRGPYFLGDAQAVIDLSAEYHNGEPIPIDYDHQLEFTEKNGAGAPASGWIVELQARADGIWGKVEWTASAATKLASREYRYISPVFAYAKSGDVLALIRAGLTNKPNLPALTAINSTQDEEMTHEKLQAEMQRIAAALGLPSTADGATLLVSVNSIVESEKIHREALTALRGKLKLADTSSADEILVAAQSTVDPSKFVPIAAHSAVLEQLATARTAESTRAVEAAMQGGKITPANKDWAIAYHAKDPAGFAEFVTKSPVIVVQGDDKRDRGTGRTSGVLSDADKAVCSTMNISEAEFLKSKEQN